jgi:hypothetical protein
MAPYGLQMTDRIEIVISRYNESLGWTLYPPFNQFRYTVYNKGPNEDFEKSRVDRVIPLENVGNECHTYLSHILANYDSLKPITVFLMGSLERAVKFKKALNTLIAIIETGEAVFLGEKVPSIREKFRGFQIDEWLGTNQANHVLNKSAALIPCDQRPYEAWYDAHFLGETATHWSYNSIFSVDQRDVLKRNRAFYERLLAELTKGPKVEVAHYIERSYAVLFGPMTYTKLQDYSQANV